MVSSKVGKMKTAFYFFVCLLAIGCQQQYRTLVPETVNFKEDSLFTQKQVSCTKLPGLFRENKCNYFLGLDILEKGDSAYIVFKGKNGFLSFADIKNLNDTPVKACYSFLGSNFFELSGNYLADFNRNQNLFKIYRITDSLTPVLCDSIVFDKRPKRTANHPEAQYLSTNFKYYNGRLIVNYRCRKGKNFIDNNALCFIRGGSREFCGKYPVKYFGNERIQTTNALFTPISDSNIVMGFSGSDEITLFRTNNEEIRRVKLSNDTGFIKFDKSKEKNLAYIDRVVQTDEKNVNLFIDAKNNLLLFKLLRKKEKNDPNKVVCFVMDNQLNPKFKFQLVREVFPYAIFRYKNGFVAFSNKFDSYDYYEIQ